jgi:hypothetical protein
MTPTLYETQTEICKFALNNTYKKLVRDVKYRTY